MNPDELDALQRDSARLHGALRALLDASPTNTLDGLDPTPRQDGARLRTQLVRRLHILHQGGNATQRAFAQDTRAAIASQADDAACFDLTRQTLERELAVDGWDTADDPTRIVALAEDLCIVWMDGKVGDASFTTFDQRWKLAHAYHGRALRRALRMTKTPLLAHLPIYTVAPPRDLNSSPYMLPPETEEDGEVERDPALRGLDDAVRRFFELTRRDESGRMLVSQLDGADRGDAAVTYGRIYLEAYALIHHGSEEQRHHARHVLHDFNVWDEHDACFVRILERLEEQLTRFQWGPMEMGVPLRLAGSLCAMIASNEVSYDLVMRFNDDWKVVYSRQSAMPDALLVNQNAGIADLPIFTTPKGERLYPW